MLFADLNCDMGEGMPNDAALMPLISSANIACGYHAGDITTMRLTIQLALQNNVAIGAHPGFDDKENFGRKEFELNESGYYDLITKQLHVFADIANSLGATTHHVKPHGALYNMSAKNKNIAAIIAKAVYDFDASLVLYGLSGSYSIIEAKAIGLKTASEVFADRTYADDGALTSRTSANSLITDDAIALQQVLQMIQSKTVTSVNGKTISIAAETICIHSDGVHAVEFASLIIKLLKENNIVIKTI